MRMQREECNEMISRQDTRAKGGVTGQVEAEIINLVSCIVIFKHLLN